MTIVNNAVVVVDHANEVYALELATGQLKQALLTNRHPVTGLSARVIDGQYGVQLHHPARRSSLWLLSADQLIDLGIWPAVRSDTGSLRAAQSAFILEGRLVEVVGEADGMLRIRDAATIQKTRRTLPGTPDGSTALVTCARLDGRPIAATCDADGNSVHLWDVAEQQVTATIEMGTKIWSLELSGDGHLLVGAGSEVIAFQHVSKRQLSSP
jgi:WD40 repeat protein